MKHGQLNQKEIGEVLKQMVRDGHAIKDKEGRYTLTEAGHRYRNKQVFLAALAELGTENACTYPALSHLTGLSTDHLNELLAEHIKLGVIQLGALGETGRSIFYLAGPSAFSKKNLLCHPKEKSEDSLELKGESDLMNLISLASQTT